MKFTNLSLHFLYFSGFPHEPYPFPLPYLRRKNFSEDLVFLTRKILLKKVKSRLNTQFNPPPPVDVQSATLILHVKQIFHEVFSSVFPFDGKHLFTKLKTFARLVLSYKGKGVVFYSTFSAD